MIEGSDIPQIIQTRISQFAWTLPSDQAQRDRIIQRYREMKGYEFLNLKSKLYKHFLFRLAKIQAQKQSQFMEEQIRVSMNGTLEELSVGGLCEVVKQNMSQGNAAYTPIENQAFQHQFSSVLDLQLYEKTTTLLHKLKLAQIEAKIAEEKAKEVKKKREKQTQRAQFAKEMQTLEDGSLGVWSGKKYEGLGTRNEFTEFRREQSQSYSQNAQPEKKKN